MWFPLLSGVAMMDVYDGVVPLKKRVMLLIKLWPKYAHSPPAFEDQMHVNDAVDLDTFWA